MKQSIDKMDSQIEFWSKDNKSALQKNLNQIFEIKMLEEQKIVKETLLLQGLALLGSLGVLALTKETHSFNKQLTFIALSLTARLTYLRSLKKKEMLKETLAAIGIFSFFKDQTSKTKSPKEKIDIIKQAEHILTPDFSNVYKPSRRAALLSGVILSIGYFIDQVNLNNALFAGIAILTACNIYELMQAKSSIRQIAKSLPKGVQLPFQANEKQRGNS